MTPSSFVARGGAIARRGLMQQAGRLVFGSFTVAVLVGAFNTAWLVGQ